MEHSSSVLAMAGALLLAGGGGSRLVDVSSKGFAARSAAASWSRPLRITEQNPSTRSPGPTLTQGSAADRAQPPADVGRFSLLTYNVAGLPELVSGSDPEVNEGLIRPLLYHYDVALVQEAFSYRRLLS